MRSIPGLMLLALMAACTTYGATNSPITEESAIAVPAILGGWVADESITPNSDTLCLRVETAGATTYRAFAGCDVEDRGALMVQFARFGGEMFAVVQPASSDSTLQGDDSVLLLYQFFRVDVRPDSLIAVELNAGALRDYLVRHPAELPYALLEGNGPDVLLTATPDQLARFLTTHARDTLLWDAEDGAGGFARRR